MQRILNNPDNIVDEMLKGFLKAHSDIVEATGNPRVVKAKNIPEGKVGVVTGGGSGHKPAFVGYVGKNMCDAVAVGEICSSPTAAAFLDSFRTADQGKGVACLYGNYSGDNMNVKMAVKMAKREGIEVKTVVANDDVASAPKDQREKRRGVAGEVLMWKVGGAKSAKGASLDEVIAAAQKAIDNTRSVGIGLSPCTLPAVGHPNFEIKDGTMEVGIGHHGEPGIEVCPLESAHDMAKRMVDVVLPDLPFAAGDEVVVLVSGLGATPVMELYVLYDEIDELLKAKGIRTHKAYVGNYFTSMEMMGATLTVMKLDNELKELIDMPAVSMGLTQYQYVAGDDQVVVHEVKEETAGRAKESAAVCADEASDVFLNKNGKTVLLKMVKAIQDNKAYLGEVDGLIGDGDHGMNMNKGFTLFEKAQEGTEYTFTKGLYDLGNILFSQIGGSMGPIYGTVLMDASDAGADLEKITTKDLADMLAAGLGGLQEIVQAQVGDKTLVDTLSPAVTSLQRSAENGEDLAQALQDMKEAAQKGMESTKDLVAKFGRSSRLGERSRGVLDAGSVSCCIILQAMADGILETLA